MTHLGQQQYSALGAARNCCCVFVTQQGKLLRVATRLADNTEHASTCTRAFVLFLPERMLSYGNSSVW